MSSGLAGEDSTLESWSQRTLQEQRDANAHPPSDFVLHAACHGAHESRVGRERCARSAAYRHTCDDDEAREFVAADAPPTLASSVHFFGAAPLIDSTARWAAVLRLDTETTFLR